MKLFIFTALVAASFISNGSAQAASKRCDTCYSDYDFKSVARSMGGGSHFIYNLHDNTIQRWYVSYDAPPMDPFESRSSVQTLSSANAPVKQSVPYAAVDELNRAHQVYLIGGAIRPIYNVPISVLDAPLLQHKTAYDAVSDANVRAMLESAAADQSVIEAVTGANIRNAIADLMSIATSYLGLRDQVGLTFKIVMTDGSTIFIKIELDEPLGEVVDGSARTASGQLIPENLPQVNGNWIGTSGGGDNLSPMVTHMSNLGAEMKWGGPSSNPVLAISCVLGTCIITVYE